MFEQIEKVVYINLEERTDRRAEVEKQLSVFPPEKVLRFNAIKHRNGLIGCGMSHIAVVELAIQNNWKNVLIVEDDMIWHKFDTGYPIYEKLVSDSFDVLCLGSACVQYNHETYKAKYVSTATAYLVNNHYYQILLETLKEGLEKLTKDESNHSLYANDRIWMKLIERDNWFVVQPTMCIQKPGYSNIENKFVNYNPQFGIW
jgi:glycosyl transferase family 25